MDNHDRLDDENSQEEPEHPKLDANGAILREPSFVFHMDLNIGGRILTISLQHNAIEDTTWTALPGFST